MSNNIKKTYAITSGKAFCKYFLAFALLLLVFPSLTATAQTSTVTIWNVNYEIDESTKTATVTGVSSKTETEYIVPNMFEYEGVSYTVTAIGEEAFKNCSDATNITIPETVKSIGKFAFKKCKQLTSFHISGLITVIEEETFCDCEKLEEIVIPATVTKICESAFEDCEDLKKMVCNRVYPPVLETDVFKDGPTNATLIVPDRELYNSWNSCFSVIQSAPQINVVELDNNSLNEYIGTYVIPESYRTKTYDGTNSVDWVCPDYNNDGTKDSIIAPVHTITAFGNPATTEISSTDVQVKVISVEFDNATNEIVAKFTLIGDKVTDYVLTQNEVSYPCQFIRPILSVLDCEAVNKEYDGNATASPTVVGSTNYGCTLQGVVPGEDVSIAEVDAHFVSPAPGSNVEFIVTLTGDDCHLYNVADNRITVPGNAYIYNYQFSPSLFENLFEDPSLSEHDPNSIYAEDKVYDGSDAATVHFPTITVGGDELTVSYTASFDSKNVVADNAVVIEITGVTCNNNPEHQSYYILPTNPIKLTVPATITPKPITIATLTAQSKNYDGNANAQYEYTFAEGGVVGEDDVKLEIASATFSDKNAEDNKTVTFSGFSLGGDAAGNYSISVEGDRTSSANISKIDLTLAVTAQDKDYDGTANASLSGSYELDGKIDNDKVSISNLTAKFVDDEGHEDPNVGENKKVKVTCTIGGEDAGNYNFTVPALTANITAATLTVSGLTAESKVYDGTTNVTITGTPIYTGLNNTTLNLPDASFTAVFGDKNVGNGKDVVVVFDTQNGNFTATLAEPLTANITARPVKIVGVAAQDKEYDGTDEATITGTATIVNSDGSELPSNCVGVSISGGTAKFNSPAVDNNKTVTFSDFSLSGDDAANYELIGQPANVTNNITAREVSITWSNTYRFDYDGYPHIRQATIGNVVTNDDCDLVIGDEQTDVNSYTAEVKSLTGAAAGNYKLPDDESKIKADFEILKVSPTFEESAKPQGTTTTYDKTAHALVTAGTVTGGNFVYSLEENGTYSETIPTGITAGDYTIYYKVQGDGNHNNIETVGSVTAKITPMPVTITGVASADKTYDGTTNAEVTGTATIEGNLDGGDLTIKNGTAHFKQSAAGENIDVEFSGFELDGVAKDNYTLSAQPATVQNKINKKKVTFTGLAADSKVYDGNPNATINYTGVTFGANEVISGDDLTITGGTATFDDANAGDNKKVTIKDYALGGVAAANYELESTADREVKSTISPKEVGIDWGTTQFVFNGQSQQPAPSATNLCNGDVCKVTVTVEGEHTSANTTDNPNYTATATALSNTNYKLPDTKPTTTFEITPKPIRITWGNTTFQYDGSEQGPEATANAEDLVGGDICAITVTGKQTNAGVYNTDETKAKATGVSNPNYTLSEITEKEKAFEITPKGVVLEWSNISLTYNGQAQAPKAIIKAGELIGGESCTVTVGGEQTNVGENYVATATLGNGNYIPNNASQVFAIGAKTLKIKANNKTITYGDELAGGGVETVEGFGFVAGEGFDNLSGTLSYTSSDYHQYYNVGTYKIKPAGYTSNNYEIDFEEGTLTVVQREVTINWSNDDEFVYDGNSHIRTATIGNVVNDDDCDLTFTEKKTDAGEYTSTAGLTGDKAGNYKLPTDHSAPFTIKKATPTIAEEDMPEPPSSIIGEDGVCELPYNGQSQNLATGGSGNPTGTTFQYRIGASGEYSSSIPTRKDVGTYTVYYIIKGNQNYSDVVGENQHFDVRIVPVPLTITAENKTVTYGSAAPAYTATYDGFVNGENESVLGESLSFDCDYQQYSSVGSYTITPKGYTSANYTIAYKDGTLTVDPKEVEIEWEDKTSFVYNGSEQYPTATVTGMVNNDNIGINYSDYGKDAKDDAYTVKLSLTGEKAGNYKLPNESTKQYSITPKEIEIATLIVNDKEYDGNTTATIKEYTFGDGVVSGDDVKLKFPTATFSNKDVGDNKTINFSNDGFSLDGTSAKNYTLSAQPQGVTASITKRDLTITANDKTITYGDAPTDNGVTYSGFVTNESASASDLDGSLSYVFGYAQYDDCDKEDKTITPQGLTSSNYNIIFSPGTLTVNQRPVVLTWTRNPANYEYNGEVQCPTATVANAVNGDVLSVTVEGGETNVGSYTATAVAITGDKAKNYKLPENKSYDFTIYKATPVVQAPTVVVTTYNGSEQALITAGSCVNGTLKYRIGSSGDFSETIPTQTKAGEYTICYEVVGNANYNDLGPFELSDKAKIQKATLTIAAENKTVTYGDAAPEYTKKFTTLLGDDTENGLNANITISCGYTSTSDVTTTGYPITISGETELENYTVTYQGGTLTVEQREVTINWSDEDEFTYDGKEHIRKATIGNVVNNDDCDLTFTEKKTDAGEYTSTATLTGEKAGNYKLPTDHSATFTIKKATPTVTVVPAENLVYNGDNQALLKTATSTGGKLLLKVDGGDYSETIPSATNAKTSYTVTYKVDGGDNYENVAEQTVEVAIGKAPLTVKANDQTIQYGDDAPAYTVAYSGFVKTEDAAVVTAGTITGEYDKTNSGKRGVGTYNITPSGFSAANYEITHSEGTLTVNQLVAEIAWNNEASFVYNAKTQNPTAYVTNKPYVDDECNVVINGGQVAVGSSYLASVSGLSNGNYQLPSSFDQKSFAITPKPVSITNLAVGNKPYDGNTNAQLSSGGTLEGICEEDQNSVEIDVIKAAFEDANVGTGKTVTFTEYTLKGSSKGNYSLVQPAPTTADITPITITVTADDKTITYGDGAPSYTVTYSDNFVNNETAADVVTGAPTIACTYNVTDANSRNKGTYDITPSGAVAANYSFEYNKGTLTVNQKEVALSWSANSLEYKAEAQHPTATVDAQSLVYNDACTVTEYEGAQTDVRAEAYTVTAKTLSNKNYKLPNNSSETFEITPKEVTIVDLKAEDREYNGNTTATTTGGKISGVFDVDEDKVTIKPGSAVFANKDVANGIVVTFSGYELEGEKAGNYSLTVQPVQSMANITPKEVTVTANDYTIYYGDEPANGGVEYDGFVDGENAAQNLNNTLTFSYTYSKGDPCGEYEIKPEGLESNNYAFTYLKGTLTVAAKAVEIVWNNPLEFEYDKISHKPTASVVGDNQCVVTVEVVEGENINVGHYTAQVTALSNANYTLPTYNLKKGFEITPKEVSITWGDTEFNYDGVAHKPVATAGNLVTGDECTVTVIGAQVDAGNNYTATATELSNHNYKLPSTNTTTAFKILPIAPSVVPPTANTLTYNGKDQVLVQAGTTNAGSLVYSLSQDGTYSADLPKGKAAQDYVVWYKVEGNKNYSSTDPARVNVTIAKAPLNVKAVSQTITYGNAVPDFTVVYDGLVNGETANIITVGTVTSTYAQYGDKGEYDIKPNNFVADNYDINYENGKLVVEPKEITILWNTKDEFAYDGDPHIREASIPDGSLVNGDLCTLTFAEKKTVASETPYTSTATLTGDKAGNYTLTNPTAKFFIKKSAPTYTALTAEDLTYNGTEQELLTSGTVTGGEFQYSLTSGGTYSTSIPQAKDADTYTVYYIVKGDANHTDVPEQSLEVTIGKKSVTIAGVESADKTYDGTTTATVTGTATISGNVDGDNLTVKVGTAAFAQSAAGNNIDVVFSGFELDGSAKDNYELSAQPATVQNNINKATLTITANDHTIVYGEQPANGGVDYSGFVNNETANVLNGALTYVYGYEQYGNVNANGFTITPSGVSNPNYEISFVDGTLTVTPREVTINWSNENSFAYDGDEHIRTATIGNVVNDDDCTLEFATAQTAASDNVYTSTASLTGEKAGNYKLPSNNTAEFAITKSAPSYEALIANILTYNGAEQNLLTSGTVIGGEFQYSLTSNGTYTTSIPQAKDADTYTVYYIVKGDENHTDVPEQSLEVTIGKKSVTIAGVESADKTYDGTTTATVTGTATISGNVDGDNLTVKVGTAAFAQSAAGSNIDVVFSGFELDGSAKDNYELSAQPATVQNNINKATLTITANDHTIVYGEQPANGGVDYSGFVNNETANVLSGALTYVYDYAQYGNVGNNYKITPGGVSNTNYEITFVKGTLTVDPREVTINWSNENSFAYDGDEHIRTATIGNVVNDDDCTLEFATAQTEASDNVYTSIASLTGAKSGNYKFPSNNTAEFAITKAAPTYEALIANALTYNGTEQNLLTPGTVIGGEFQFSLTSGGTYSTSIPQAKDADTYTVYYIVKGDANHTDVPEQSLEVTIGKKSVTIAGVKSADKTYDGTTTATITGTATISGNVDGDNLTVKVGTAAFAQSAAGSNIDVVFSGFELDGSAKDNYELSAQPVPVKNNINKALLTITANDHSIVYGEQPANGGVEYSGFVNNETANVLSGALTYAYDYEQYGNVGNNYKITPGGVSNPNYEILFVDGTLTVNQREVTINWCNENSFAYDGDEHIRTATIGNVVSDDDCTLEFATAQTAAGDNYTSTATLTGAKASNYKLPSNNTAEFAITKSAPSYEALTANTLTYNGAEQELLTSGTVTGGAFQYSLTQGGTYSTSIPQAKDADTYTIYYIVKGDANHTDVPEQSLEVTISKKSVTIAGVKSADKTYDGTTAATVTGTATISGNVDGDNLTVKVGTAAFAQSAAGSNIDVVFSGFEFDGSAKDNYELSAQPATVQNNINKATLTITANDHTIVYGEQPANGGVEYSGFVNNETANVLSGALTYAYDYEQYDDVNANGFAIRPSGVSNPNYEISFEGGTLTVTPREVTINWSNENSFAYDGDEHIRTATIGNVVHGDDCTLEFATAQTAASDNVYTSTASLTGEKASNYKLPSNNSAEFAITKAAPTYEALIANTLTYNGAEQNLLSSGTVIGGEFQYSLTQGGTYSTSIPQAKDAGDYTVYYIVKGDANHTDVPEQSLEVTIGKKSVTIAGVKSADKTYDGTTTATVNTGTATIDGNVDGDNLTVKVGTAAFAQSAAGSNIDVVFSGFELDGSAKDNYELSAQPATVQNNINKAALTITAKPHTIIYGEQPANGGVEYSGFVNNETASVLSGALTYAYDYEQYDDVNANGFAIRPSGVSNPNYEISFVDGTLTVDPREVTINWSNENSFAYDGDEHIRTATIGNVVNDDDCTLEFATAQTEASDNVYTSTASLTGEKAGNYKLPSNNTAEFAITKSAPSYEALIANTLIYNGTEQELLTSGAVTGGAFQYSLTSNGTYTTSIPQAKDADTYTVYYIVKGDANHTDVPEQSLEVTIGKKSVTIAGVKSADKTYDGTTAATVTGAATIDGNVDGDNLTVKVGTAAFAQSAAGSNIDVVFSGFELDGSAKDNYELSAQPATVQNDINKATLTITANDHTIVYGEQPANGGVEYSGFVNNETANVLSGALTYSYTYAQYGNVGADYTITPGGVSNPNYEISFVDGTLTVNPREVTINWSNENSFAYDGDAHIRTATIGNVVNGDDCTLEFATAQTAASDNYTSTASLTGEKAGNYKLPSNNTAEFAITKSAPTYEALTANVLTYNGAEQNLLTPGTVTGGAFQFSLTQGGTYTTSIPQAKDADTYTVYYIVKGDANHTDVPEQSLKVTIGKKSVTIAGVKSADKTYDGTTAATVTGAATIDGNVDGNNLTIKVGTAAFAQSAAGNDIDVVFSGFELDGSAKDNYELSAQPATVQNNINKASLTITANDHTIVYGEQPANNGVEYSDFVNNETASVLSGALTYAYNYEQYDDVNANGFAIRPSGVSNPNYEISFEGGTLTVTPREVTINWSNENSFAYDGDEHIRTATIGNVVNGDDCTLEFATAQTEASDNVYTSTASLTGEKASNYKLPSNNTAEFAITKSAPSYEALIANALTYNGAEQNLLSSGSVTGGEFQYSLTQGGTYSTSIPKAKDAGNYTVYYIVKGDANHTDVPEQSLEVTISKKEVELVWGERIFPYDKQSHVPVAHVKDDNECEVTVKVLENESIAAGYYTAEATALSNPNYALPAFGLKLGFEISPKEVSLTWSGSEFFYNGEAQWPTAEAGDLVAGDECKVTVSGAEVEVGEYVATAVELSNLNYKLPSNETVNEAFVIKRVDPIVVAPVAQTLTYNGKEQALINAGSTTAGEILYSLDGQNYSKEIPTAKDALAYTVYYKVDETRNFFGFAAQTVDVTIAKAPVEILWNDLTFVYNGQEQKPEARLTGLFVEDNLGLTVEGGQTNAGSYTAKAVVNSSNYEVVSTDQTAFEILPLKLVVGDISVKTEKDYDGTKTAEILSGNVTSNALEGDGIVISAVAEYNDVAIASHKTITVNLSVSDNPNYYLADEDKQFVYTNEGKIFGQPNLVLDIDKDYAFGASEVGNDIFATAYFDGQKVSGRFVYTPEKGTMLRPVGTSQEVTVRFIPDDECFSEVEATFNVKVINNIVPDQVSIKVDVTNKYLCSNQLLLSYQIISGRVERYSLEFDNPLLQARQGSAGNAGEILIDLPENLEAGTYTGHITFSDEDGNASYPCDFTFTTKLPAKMLYQLYKDVVFVNGEFEGYQWYKNGEILNGETNQYLSEDNDLYGSYHALVTLENGDQFETCPLDIYPTISKSKAVLSVYPNPAMAMETVHIDVMDFDEDKPAKITIHTNSGVLVKKIENAQSENTVSLPAGNYTGVFVQNGVRISFKIIVK